ncbi:hypothetical protein Q0M94_19125 (plasmid) [Deinococcus radiomollis]|uniref:hypothetical protein n=1 Tax=Deinococcus radiomollis TaxID=468916 RepID=UPI003891EFD4
MPEIKALSDYFMNGGKVDEGKDAKTLSASKLQKAIIEAMLPGKPLHKKVFKVADHFYIHTDEGREGEVEKRATIGEFRKLAETDSTYKKQKGSRSGKQSATVYGDFYRDFAILDVDAFENWLIEMVLHGPADVIQKNKGRTAGPKNNTSGIYSLAELMAGDIDLNDVAAKQTKVIQSRITRGRELGNSGKEDSKSTTKKGRK